MAEANLKITIKNRFISVNGFEEKEEGYSCYEGKDLYR